MIDDFWSAIEARLEAMMSLQYVSATNGTNTREPQPKIPNSSSRCLFRNGIRVKAVVISSDASSLSNHGLDTLLLRCQAQARSRDGTSGARQFYCSWPCGLR